jgi:hypothetical protein
LAIAAPPEPVAVQVTVPPERWLAEEAPRLDRPEDSGWTVRLEEGFDRQDPGEGWTVVAGEWEVAAGRLRAQSRTEESIALWTAVDFSGDFRLSYRARAVKPSPEGGPCDLTLLCALPATLPVDPRGGYLFRFGSYVNQTSGLSWRHYNLVEDHARLIVPGVWHTIVAQRRGRRLAMEIDGEVLFSGEHAAASVEPESRWGGFYVWKSIAEFDDVVYSVPRTPEPEDAAGGVSER